jgi:uncharacterized protein YuzE
MMRFEYDKEVDAAYLYLEYPIESGAAARTVKASESVALDFASDGHLLGIEILGASKTLSKKALMDALHPTR